MVKIILFLVLIFIIFVICQCVTNPRIIEEYGLRGWGWNAPILAGSYYGRGGCKNCSCRNCPYSNCPYRS
jgi:hypothetical protein